MKRSLALVTCMALFLSLAAFSPACAKPKQITIFTSLAGSTWYGIGAGMAKIFATEGVSSNAELGAAMSNIANVVAGKGESGLTSAVSVSIAQAGEPPFKEKIAKVRAILGLAPNYLQIVTPKADNTMDIKELAGKRFVTQPKGAITAEVFSRTLKAYGMQESDINLSRGSLDIQTDQMKDRHSNGMVTMSSFPAGFLSELSNNVPLRLLPVSDEALAKLRADLPGLTRAVIPPNTYKGQDVAVPTVMSKLCFFVSADMPEEDAYWMTKALMTHADEVRALHSSYKDLTNNDFAEVPGVPLHPGAERYYREAGIIK